jgi:hypothetical protein
MQIVMNIIINAIIIIDKILCKTCWLRKPTELQFFPKYVMKQFALYTYMGQTVLWSYTSSKSCNSVDIWSQRTLRKIC